MKKFLALLLVSSLVFIPAGFVFAGGDEDNASNVEGALEDQIYKTRELEDKVSDLERQLDDLKNRPPQIVKEERVIEREAASDSTGAFKLPIHGFFNTNYADSNIPGADGTFDQENLSLLFDYDLDENFRFGGELNFMHGTEIDVDLTEVYGVGEVNVMEAYLDWKFNDANIVKVGKFLTPYGNWNIPLRSPAKKLSIWDPLTVRRNIFVKTMTGIQYYGKAPVANIDVLYNVYLGNGEGFWPNSEDNNTNKGLGARAAILTSFINSGTCELGISAYTGRDGRLNDEDENNIGFDALVNVFPFQLRGEYAKVEYLIVDGGGSVDKYAWYIQGSVNFLEKYDAYLRYDKEDTDEVLAFDDQEITTIGINYKPIPVVALKLEYDMHDSLYSGNYEVIAGSVAVDF